MATFGYTSQGASSWGICRDYFGYHYAYRKGCVFTPSEGGTLDNISTWVKASNISQTMYAMTVFLNEKDSGGAGNHGQVASKENTNFSVNNVFQLFTFTTSSESFNGGTDYILGAVGDPYSLSGNYWGFIPYDTGTTKTYYQENFTASDSDHLNYTNSLESPWTNTSNSGEFLASIYATYTVAGGGGGGPTADSKMTTNTFFWGS